MKVLVVNIILLLFFVSCSVRNVSHIEKNNHQHEDHLRPAIQAYYSWKYKELVVPDTIVIEPEVYFQGCASYGMSSFSFYYGFIDTLSFPNLKKDMSKLSYYRNIQERLEDTIILEFDHLIINSKRVIIDYVVKDKTNYIGFPGVTVTPLKNSGNDIYSFDVLNGMYTYMVSLQRKEEDYVCVDVREHDASNGFNPCSSAPDTLRTNNFDLLYKEYGLKN